MPENQLPAEPPSPGSSWAALSKALEPIRWDWPGWLPQGFLTILASKPGVGKSLLCLRLAASYLDGLPWPDDTPIDLPGNTAGAAILWCESEAGHAMNLQRARTWGLDLSRIFMPLSNPLRNFKLDVPQHYRALLKLARRDPVRLVVLDSLRGLRSARRDRANMNDLLSALADLARIAGKPVILTHHLRKGKVLDDDGRLTVDRLLGSAAIPQSARVIWALDTPDPADPGNRRLSVIKNNLAPPPDPIGMRVDDDGPHFGPPPQAPSPNPELDRAVDFLREQLADGPAPSRLLKAKYLAAGLSDMTIRRAKKRLAVDSFRPSGQRRWFWALPDKKQKS
ncbi:MAG: AAA family ATPase [Candidatus Promineifilaceae bacterium]|nr:AAA family ATPase [Candidatus Promineifilaceae bacterium]